MMLFQWARKFIMNSEYVRIWKDEVVAYLKALLSQDSRLPGRHSNRAHSNCRFSVLQLHHHIRSQGLKFDSGYTHACLVFFEEELKSGKERTWLHLLLRLWRSPLYSTWKGTQKVILKRAFSSSTAFNHLKRLFHLWSNIVTFHQKYSHRMTTKAGIDWRGTCSIQKQLSWLSCEPWKWLKALAKFSSLITLNNIQLLIQKPALTLLFPSSRDVNEMIA
jgi:hypothetical protein